MIDRLETNRLILRKARAEDLETIWNNVWRDEALAETMLWKPTVTRGEAIARMERTIAYQRENYAYFVCLKQGDLPIGFAGVKETAPGAFEETGICVAGAYQKRGFGKEILRALIELAFVRLGGNSFLYGCFRENNPSRKLCQSCGFTYSHSEACVRDWDRRPYVCDFYRLVKEE